MTATRKKVVENYSPSTGQAVRLAAIPADCAGLRCDSALARMFPEYSRNRLAAWLKAGRITVAGAAATPKVKVWGGEAVTLDAAPDPQAMAFQPQDIPLAIVFEDEHLIVINKPPGLVVHPGSGNWDGTMLNALLQHAPPLAQLPRAGIVHRLDKDTSGLLVVAKTLPAQTSLVRQLQEHSVTREYSAVVHGLVAHEGTVDAPIGRHKTQRTRMAVVPGGKPSVTHYEPVEHFTGATLIACKLETGRTHQIRVHMASIGHAIVGDPVYGVQRHTHEFPRQALHAGKLALTHPATCRVRSWSAPLPADMKKLLVTLRNA